MVRVDVPNKPGDYTIDGVSIIILPDKIIVDTGNRASAYAPKSHKETKKEPAKKKEKDWVNSLLDNAEDLVMGRKKVN